MPLYLFLFILIFSPLAFGTVEYWSLGTVEAVVPATLLLLYLRLQINKDQHLRVPGLLPLVLLLCWMGLQLVPLPPGLVRTIAPKIYETYLPLLQLSDHQPWIPLTVQPKASLQELLRFSSYALFFVLTIQLLSRSDRLQKTVTVVAWLGIAIAVEAIIQKLTSPQAIYWFRAAPPSTSPMGPWVYCNHFAGFMEMVFPLVVALFLFHRPQISYEEPLRDRILSMFTMSGANKHMLFGTGAMLMAVAILLSVSRGGIITLCLALLFFTVFMSRQNGQWRNKWLVVLITLVLLMISWLGWDPIMHKFSNIWGEQGLNTSSRLPVLLDSINMARDFILTGSGFGTYEVAFPAYRTVPGDSIYFDHAHNDYIELLATGGLIGFLLAAWFIVAVLFHVIRKVSRRREQYNILVTTAALTGILGLLLHCFVDFQMYNGANALYFFFLCGLAVSAANTRLQYRTRPTLLSPANRFQGPLTAVLALTVLVSGLWYNSAV
ncbi:MAG: O-antigen ligase family protein, partial [Deltaproteobacteria bacterium]|nr:O-antigen ligase family protein [Deltaproteobacteria bacterium]